MQGGQGTEKSDKAKGGSKGRILLVVSSIDRGQRLGRKFRNLDKMNYVLMMMDEMREACEVRCCTLATCTTRLTSGFHLR